MDPFQNPVGSHPRDPYEGYRVEPVKEEKENLPQLPTSEKSKKNLSLAAQFLLFFRRMLDFFEGRKGGANSSERQFKDDLLQLKACFDLLKTEDRSQDTEFLRNFSNLWDHCLEISIRFPRDNAGALEFKKFIRTIQSYPPHQEHSLAYYLAEHAGQKWIPFPFMELIHKLHVEHQNNPSDSLLNQWSQTLHEIIAFFTNID